MDKETQCRFHILYLKKCADKLGIACCLKPDVFGSIVVPRELMVLFLVVYVVVERYHDSQGELLAQSSWSMSQEQSGARETDR